MASPEKSELSIDFQNHIFWSFYDHSPTLFYAMSVISHNPANTKLGAYARQKYEDFFQSHLMGGEL